MLGRRVLMGLAGVLALAWPAVADNLIVNGDFEQSDSATGKLPGWRRQGQKVERTVTGGFESSAGMTLSRGADETERYRLIACDSIFVPRRGDRRYELAFAFRTQGVSAERFRVEAVFYDQAGKVLGRNRYSTFRPVPATGARSDEH